MGKIIRVDLENLRFYSYHGFYPEEQILGNEYYLSIKTTSNKVDMKDEELENTVNYEVLYAIASKSMKTPRKLLESVVNEILEEVRIAFPKLQEIEVSICKINPPFGGDQAQARVSLSWHHNN